MSRGFVIVRVAALLVLAVATRYALDRWALTPLRCIRAATAGGVELDAASTQRSDYRTQLLAHRVRAELEGCDCVNPPEVAIPFARGAAAELTGDPHSAIAEYKRSLLIDRRPEIYLRLGLAQLAVLDHSEAIENLARACAFNPRLLSEIPYEGIRSETTARLRATYPEGWIR
jgi:tetratricopeptide (TPR) repeat protein